MRGRVLLDILQPVGDVVEGLQICDVVQQQDAHRAPVVGGGERSEALLTGGVPNLQLDRNAVEIDDFLLKVYA